MGVLAYCCAFGAIPTKVERAVKAGFLSNPDAIIDFGNYGTTDRAVRTDGLDRLDSSGRSGLRRGLCDGSTSGCNCRQSPNRKSRTAQEAAPINAACLSVATIWLRPERRVVSVSFFPQHGLPP